MSAGCEVMNEIIDCDIIKDMRRLDVESDPSEPESSILRLEEGGGLDLASRRRIQQRNMLRIQEAREKRSIQHLELSFSSCVDAAQKHALEALLHLNDRKWKSFTLRGVEEMANIYNRLAPIAELRSILFGLRHIETLNLYSSSWYRGHDLDQLFKLIPLFPHLRELRVEGWQLDRISVSALCEGIHQHISGTIALVSLRSSVFMGGHTFEDFLTVLPSLSKLTTLNMGFCRLDDTQIVTLCQRLKQHGSLQHLHIGGNDCTSTISVEAISSWIQEEDSLLKDLNLRGLWAGYSEDGLLCRSPDLSPLYQAIAVNTSLCALTLSENCLDDTDLAILVSVLESRNKVYHLDVSENPFSVRGAQALLGLVRTCTGLDSIRLHNSVTSFDSEREIQLCARLNHFHKQLSSSSTKPHVVPLSLWPHIFQALNRDSLKVENDFAPDLLFHFLQHTSGKNGLQLAYRIAEAPTRQLE